ncbi:hypothetical protein, partial [Microbulbifer discodermiae]|uniref:hypothetical protein n=1 Tax=Microbulbifer sp. 2201CG32-9 TaxID=3232309 RepID=UPI00345C1D97
SSGECRRRFTGFLAGIISLILGVHLLIGGHLNYSAEFGLVDEFAGRLPITWSIESHGTKGDPQNFS